MLLFRIGGMSVGLLCFNEGVWSLDFLFVCLILCEFLCLNGMVIVWALLLTA